MRRRPWEIWFLTLVYLFAPFGNLGFTCWVRGYDWTEVGWLVLALTPSELLALGLYPALAWAVFSVTRGGWWVFVALNALLFGLNLEAGARAPGADLVAATLANLANAAVAALLVTRHARSPYFSPRVQWWNRGPQYRIGSLLEVPILLRAESQGWVGQVADVGPGGCFVEVEADLRPGAVVDLEFACWGLSLRLRGQAVWSTSGPEGRRGWGLRFVGLGPDDRRHLRALVATLKAHRVPRDRGEAALSG